MKKTIPLLLLFVAIGMSITSHAQNLTWSKLPTIPHNLAATGTFSINSKVYVVCGATATSPLTLTNEVWEFNTANNTWTQKNNFPGHAVYAQSTFAIGNYGYMVNGWNSAGNGTGSDTLWRYDPSTDSWTTKASFPGSARYTCASFALNGKGYIATGYQPATNDLYVYDPTADTWTKKANYPGGNRQSPVWFPIGNYVYMGMGSDAGYNIYNDWSKYDPATDTWTALNPFPGDAVTLGGHMVINGEGYMVNGEVQSNFSYKLSPSKKVWKYTPTTDTWTLMGVFPDTSTFNTSSTVWNNVGYFGFGEIDFLNYAPTNIFWRFGPGTAPYTCQATIYQYRMAAQEFNFQAMGNFAPGATLTWNFGDGTSGSGTSVIHSYAHTGGYPITLTVVDSADTCSYTVHDSVNVYHMSSCATQVHATHAAKNYILYTTSSGAAPFTYQWSCTQDPNFHSTAPDPFVTLTPNSTYNYCVSVTDTLGCVAKACNTVVYHTSVDTCGVAFYISPDPNYPGLYVGYIYYTGDSITSYHWDFGDGNSSNDSLPNHQYATNAYFNVCLTLHFANGCSATYCDSIYYAYKVGGGPMGHLIVKARQKVTSATGVKDIEDPSAFRISPNPAQTMVYITSGEKIKSVSLYDVTGQKVIDTNVETSKGIDVSSLSAGIYMIQIQGVSHTSHTKLVKE